MSKPERDVLQAVREAPRELLPAVLAAVAARLAEPEPAPEKVAECNGDRLLSAEEVALRLGLDVSAVARRRFPFAVKMGHRTLRYSEQGLAQWLHQGGGSQSP